MLVNCLIFSAETATATEIPSKESERPATAEEKHEGEATEKDTSEIAEDPPAPAEEPAEPPKEEEDVKPADPAAAAEKPDESEAQDEVPPLNPDGIYLLPALNLIACFVS